MTEKGKYLGRESGKSSARFFGGEGRDMPARGHGASAGDGKTSILGLVKKVVFKDAKEK